MDRLGRLNKSVHLGLGSATWLGWVADGLFRLSGSSSQARLECLGSLVGSGWFGRLGKPRGASGPSDLGRAVNKADWIVCRSSRLDSSIRLGFVSSWWVVWRFGLVEGRSGRVGGLVRSVKLIRSSWLVQPIRTVKLVGSSAY